MPGPTPGEMHALNSSNLLGYRYDHDTATLTIEFNSGHTYQYAGVPQSIVDGLKNADSAGSYFARQIRGHYTHKSVT